MKPEACGRGEASLLRDATLERSLRPRPEPGEPGESKDIAGGPAVAQKGEQ